MEISQQTICFHCGNDCESEILKKDDHSFCCVGCVSVYSILQDNGLCNYYDFQNNPGIQLKSKSKNEFAYLEKEEIIEQIIEFKNEDYIQVSFYVPQIHCYSCIWLLEKLYQLRDGITKSSVNYLKKEITIGFNHSQITLREVVELLTSIGYEPLINLDQKDREKKQNPLRRLYLQIGITGFCFGNIMLLSFPEYISGIHNVEPEYAQYFGFINLVLSLPILFFGAIDYFKSSFGAIKNNRINLDIPIAIGISALFIFSVWEISTQTGSGYFDSLGGLIFFLLGGKLFQQKTFDQLNFERDYKSYFPLAVTRITEGNEEPIPAAHVQEGDRLLIRNGEVISCDCLLFTSSASIDYSFVSGESVPVEKVTGEKLYAGGRLVGQAIEVEVIKVTSQSYLTKLWNQYENEQKNNKLNSLSDTISRYFIIAVVAIAFGSALYWWQFDTAIALKAFTSVLIVACPCALALSIPFTYGNVIRLLGNQHFYVKNTNVLEVMASIKQLVFDKTGTLTSLQEAKVKYEGIPLSKKEYSIVKSVLKHSNHPLSRAIFNNIEGKPLPLDNFIELPGKGLEANYEGTLIKIGSSNFVNNTNTSTVETAVYISFGEEIKGRYVLNNVYLNGIQTMFQQLIKNYGITILSGDNEQEKHTIQELTHDQATIRFNQSPFDKQEYIHLKESEGYPTMMIGDGLNDSGALKAAQVGIAVTQNASNFSPSSDIIVDSAYLTLLPNILKFVKASKWVVYISFGISFSYNLVGLFFAVQGKLSPLISAILMPISSISVMIFALLTTSIVYRKIVSNKQ